MGFAGSDVAVEQESAFAGDETRGPFVESEFYAGQIADGARFAVGAGLVGFEGFERCAVVEVSCRDSGVVEGADALFEDVADRAVFDVAVAKFIANEGVFFAVTCGTNFETRSAYFGGRDVAGGACDVALFVATLAGGCVVVELCDFGHDLLGGLSMDDAGVSHRNRLVMCTISAGQLAMDRRAYSVVAVRG